MNRRSLLALCGVGIGPFTGCLDNAPESGGDDETSHSNETRTDGVPRETTAPSIQDAEQNASPHEFVHVEPVADRSELKTVDANETTAFQNLSRRRQRTFRAALDREEVAADGWSYYNESRPEYVRYNDSWFRVIVGVH